MPTHLVWLATHENTQADFADVGLGSKYAEGEEPQVQVATTAQHVLEHSATLVIFSF